jgi:hypothetical protein
MAISLVACGNKDNGGVEVAETPAPILTDEVNVVVAEEVGAVSLVELTGTANIERGEEEINARTGMRLMNRDTLRTLAESAAWLLLEEDRAVELGELTALHIDKQEKGFVLTLTEGEVTAQIDRPLGDAEEFMVVAGNLVLAVRGTIFTVRIDGTIVTVSVERGEVAVFDNAGEEIATVKAGESLSFDTGDGNVVVATQTQAPVDGYEVGDIVEFGDYEWRVLEVSEGKALLLSEYVLEHRAYHEEYVSITWEACTLRAYLNGEFYNTFSENDRARMVETHNENQNNQWNYTQAMESIYDSERERAPRGGADTNDKIFLLSIEEVVRYLGDGEQLPNITSDGTGYIDDDYNIERIAYNVKNFTYTGNFEGGSTFTSEAGIAAWWWLRSPGFYSELAAHVYDGGSILAFGDTVTAYFGVRPALWLVLE